MNRLARPVRLTPAGEFFLESRRRIASIDARTRQFCADWAGSKSGRLRIACNGERINGMLIPVIAEFAKRHPGIRLDLDLELRLEEIPGALLKGEADIGILFEHLLAPGLNAFPLCRERYLLAVADRPENAAFGAPYNEAGDYPLVFETGLDPVKRLPLLPTLQHEERTAILSKALGFSLQPLSWRVRQLGTRAALAAAGLCSAVCQERLIGSWQASRLCRFASLEQVLPVQHVVIAFNEGEYQSQAAEAFCRTALSVCSRAAAPDAAWPQACGTSIAIKA